MWLRGYELIEARGELGRYVMPKLNKAMAVGI